MTRAKGKRGQSILEYVLVITGVIAIILWAAAGPIKSAVEKIFNDTDQAVGNVANKTLVE
ncbi:hypothetical protein ACFL1K_04295 [Candidatus Omnitrophota bacterium]